ncbi:hypothetical protein BD769DRAFT_1498877 [Suillus cothurnatus]|nr:hypothetical protein BD769DRAFT_1498877 [Suillus cothurnatus]
MLAMIRTAHCLIIFSQFLTNVLSAILIMQQLSPTLRMPALEAIFKTIFKTSIPPLPSSMNHLHCIHRVTPIMYHPSII